MPLLLVVVVAMEGLCTRRGIQVSMWVGILLCRVVVAERWTNTEWMPRSVLRGGRADEAGRYRR